MIQRMKCRSDHLKPSVMVQIRHGVTPCGSSPGLFEGFHRCENGVELCVRLIGRQHIGLCRLHTEERKGKNHYKSQNGADCFLHKYPPVFILAFFMHPT